MYSTLFNFHSIRYYGVFLTIVGNNEECIIFSVIDILCFEEDGSTFKKKMKPPTFYFFKACRLIIHLSFVTRLNL